MFVLIEDHHAKIGFEYGGDADVLLRAAGVGGQAPPDVTRKRGAHVAV